MPNGKTLIISLITAGIFILFLAIVLISKNQAHDQNQKVAGSESISLATVSVTQSPQSNNNSTQEISTTISDKTTSSESGELVASPTSSNNKEEKSMLSQNFNLEKPSMEIDKNKKYLAVLETSEGIIHLELNALSTPITVNNFVYLAKKGFYDNTIFHRVIKGFMIQGGDPLGNGTGGPGYKFADEAFDGEYTRGTVAMANAGPNTNGSQFFIMHKDYPLQKNYVIFGKLVKGFDVLDKIADSPVEMSSSGEKSKPITSISLNKVSIVEE